MGCLWVGPSFSPNPSHSCLSICLTMGHYFLRRSNPFLYTFNCSLHLRLIYSLMKGLLSSRDIPDIVLRARILSVSTTDWAPALEEFDSGGSRRS